MNLPEQNWRKAILPNNVTIDQVIRNLNQTAFKIVMVTNENGALEGTISDGDIRRALVQGLDLKSQITNVIHRNALVVPPELDRVLVKQLMVANKIQQIPVVDAANIVMGLHLWDEITATVVRPNLMVIMAGGKGTRLLPHTENCPKPLLEIAGKPMLEHIIVRAKSDGFTNFVIAIHYLGHMIEAHFGNGEKLGVHIEYLKEESPLGTAGALGLLNPLPNSPVVVTHGDGVTDIRYGELLDFHIRYEATATMAVRLHEWQHPFGVVKTSGIEIVGFEEKPVSQTHINAGVYVLNPSSLKYLEVGKACDMPEFFQRVKSHSGRTLAYPMHELWLDVGRPDDLIKANSIIN